MTSLAIELPGGSKIQTTNVSDDTLSVDLSDGRTIVVPLAWYPRLLHGSTEERNNWRLISHGEGIHWPDLDEDISLKNIILGQPSGESQSSLQRWLKMRSKVDLNLRDMSDEYTNLKVNYPNEEGKEKFQISEEDRSEILRILNQKQFSQREDVSSLKKSNLGVQKVIDELDYLYYSRLQKNWPIERRYELKDPYVDFLKSKLLDLCKRNGLEIVHGYVVEREKISQPQLVLLSHAVVKEKSGNLIELTTSFKTKCYDFIEHSTGRFDIDCIATKSRVEESTSSLLLLSETSLAEDWDNPEEDAAWAHLQQVM
jgi:hypothetical protein